MNLSGIRAHEPTERLLLAGRLEPILLTRWPAANSMDSVVTGDKKKSGIIRKYGLNMSRQAFREKAQDIGFVKVRLRGSPHRQELGSNREHGSWLWLSTAETIRNRWKSFMRGPFVIKIQGHHIKSLIMSREISHGRKRSIFWFRLRSWTPPIFSRHSRLSKTEAQHISTCIPSQELIW